MRGMGRTNDNPTAYDFKYRLRWYILGKHSSSIFVSNANTEPQSSSDENPTRPVLIKSPNIVSNLSIEDSGIDEMNNQECITSIQFKSLKIVQEEENEKEHIVANLQFPSNIAKKVTDIDLHSSSLTYIAGYVAFRFKNKYNFLHKSQTLHTTAAHIDSDDWISRISRGQLLHPTEAFLEIIKNGENIFKEFYGDNFNKSNGIITKVSSESHKKTQNILNTPMEVIKCFVRTRIYIRIRHINKTIKNVQIDRQDLKRKKIHAPHLSV